MCECGRETILIPLIGHLIEIDEEVESANNHFVEVKETPSDFRVLFFQFLFGSKLKKCGSSLIAKGKRVGTAKGKPEDTEIMGLSTGRACDSDCHGLMDSLRYQKKTIVRCRSRRTSRGRNGMTSEMYLINERH